MPTVIQPPLSRLSVRRGQSQHGLHEGVPAHLRTPLGRWARHELGSVPESLGGDANEQNSEEQREERLAQVAVRAGVALRDPSPMGSLIADAAGMVEPNGYANLFSERDLGDDFLALVDMHLQMCGGGEETLSDLLEAGGSAWTVGGSPPRLLRRVVDQQREQLLVAASANDAAADEISEAWVNAYGRDPDPSDAWDHAIKAVEILLHPIVSPTNARATLGTMLRDLEAKPEKWSLALATSSTTVGAVEALTGMLRLIWPNPDRHGSGSGSYRVPTQEEAEQVVGLGVFVVGWLRTGVLRTVAPAAGASGSP